MSYSVIIKNGTIIDGTGAPAFVADLGIEKEKISAIGDLSQEKADFIFDASGLIVCPGFIDLTSHSDIYGTIFYVPTQESLISQGVTTILLGNCGQSLAPVVKKESLKELERWTNFPINVSWNTMSEYLNVLEKNGVGVNCATLVGQETLLKNGDDQKSRLFLLEKALHEGALGLSSNFSFHHLNGELEEETKTLLKILKKVGGIYKIHLRDEGKDFLPSVAYAVDLARKSGVQTVISHFKSIGRGAWKDFKKAINIIENARKENIKISFDVFPYLRTGSQLLALLPLWAREGSHDEILQRLNNNSSIEHIIRDLVESTLHPEQILVAGAGEDKKIIGKTLQQISEDLGKSLEETIIEILISNNLNVTVFGRTLSHENLIESFKKDYCVVASNGAGFNFDFKKFRDLAHPRSFGTFPRFVGLWASESGLSKEEAIKKVTSLPAHLLSLKDRGIIKKGFFADLNVFDYNNFKDFSTYLNPYQYSTGVKLLLLAGKVAYFEEKFLGKFGKIIKRT